LPYQLLKNYDTLKKVKREETEMEYKAFLKTTLPVLGLRWRRFRGKNIRRRIVARMQLLGLSSFDKYRNRLLENPDEQRELTNLLTVTISRFWRDARLFEALEMVWFPAVLSRLSENEPLCIWSAGCASGEEPYSLLILWHESFAATGRELRLLASDSDSCCLKRASVTCYPASSFREMPLRLRQKYCSKEKGSFCLPSDFWKQIEWVEHNLIYDPPFPDNHLIFCRNLAYTYFTEPLQEKVTQGFHQALVPGGLLVVGHKDCLPASSSRLFEAREHPVYARL